MLPATPSRRIILKLALAAALLTLAAAARLPFIGNILAGEEGYFAALVLNGTPTSALDDSTCRARSRALSTASPFCRPFIAR